MSLNQFYLLNYFWIALAFLIFFVLIISHIRAPYGRHSNKKWGKTIANRWGWFWMELPALLLFPLLTIFGPSEKNQLTWLLVGLWLLHYINRTFIFPFRLKTSGKRMPLVIMISALFFNGMNGFLNGYYLGFFVPEKVDLNTWNVYVGLVLFFVGFYINQAADTKLINLRNESNEYQIPRGWLFKYISCPNHFGEIIEWFGFAFIAYNLPAFTFAIWTFCNLVPRALNHHAWYFEHFKNYPKNRKAIFPFSW